MTLLGLHIRALVVGLAATFGLFWVLRVWLFRPLHETPMKSLAVSVPSEFLIFVLLLTLSCVACGAFVAAKIARERIYRLAVIIGAAAMLPTFLTLGTAAPWYEGAVLVLSVPAALAGAFNATRLFRHDSGPSAS